MTTVLSSPLGNRVLIDGDGVPYAVVPEGTSLRPQDLDSPGKRAVSGVTGRPVGRSR